MSIYLTRRDYNNFHNPLWLQVKDLMIHSEVLTLNRVGELLRLQLRVERSVSKLANKNTFEGDNDNHTFNLSRPCEHKGIAEAERFPELVPVYGVSDDNSASQPMSFSATGLPPWKPSLVAGHAYSGNQEVRYHLASIWTQNVMEAIFGLSERRSSLNCPYYCNASAWGMT